MKNIKIWIGIGIFVLLVIAMVIIRNIQNNAGALNFSNLTDVYVATGGGKEDFLADEEIQKILKSKYKLNAKVPLTTLSATFVIGTPDFNAISSIEQQTIFPPNVGKQLCKCKMQNAKCKISEGFALFRFALFNDTAFAEAKI